MHTYMGAYTESNGSRTFSPDIFPRTFYPEKNANNVVEIEAGMIKQYL